MWTEDLPSDLRDEVYFYSDWRVGEFDGPEGLIPRSDDWVHGASGEPYGWVDKEELGYSGKD